MSARLPVGPKLALRARTMNPSTGIRIPSVSTSLARARRQAARLRLVFWIALGLVAIVAGACEALAPSAPPRHLEIAPDRPVRPLLPVGPEPPESELIA